MANYGELFSSILKLKPKPATVMFVRFTVHAAMTMQTDVNCRLGTFMKETIVGIEALHYLYDELPLNSKRSA